MPCFITLQQQQQLLLLLLLLLLVRTMMIMLITLTRDALLYYCLITGSGLSDGETISLGFYEQDDLMAVIEYLRARCVSVLLLILLPLLLLLLLLLVQDDLRL